MLPELSTLIGGDFPKWLHEQVVVGLPPTKFSAEGLDIVTNHVDSGYLFSFPLKF
jgi:hypothetical protein